MSERDPKPHQKLSYPVKEKKRKLKYKDSFVFVVLLWET